MDVGEAFDLGLGPNVMQLVGLVHDLLRLGRPPADVAFGRRARIQLGIAEQFLVRELLCREAIRSF